MDDLKGGTLVENPWFFPSSSPNLLFTWSPEKPYTLFAAKKQRRFEIWKTILFLKQCIYICVNTSQFETHEELQKQPPQDVVCYRGSCSGYISTSFVCTIYGRGVHCRCHYLVKSFPNQSLNCIKLLRVKGFLQFAQGDMQNTPLTPTLKVPLENYRSWRIALHAFGVTYSHSQFFIATIDSSGRKCICRIFTTAGNVRHTCLDKQGCPGFTR